MPADRRSAMGSNRSADCSRSEMVVDSPPGRIRASTPAKSSGRRTSTGWASRSARAALCSRTSPCRASTPTFAPVGRAGTWRPFEHAPSLRAPFINCGFLTDVLAPPIAETTEPPPSAARRRIVTPTTVGVALVVLAGVVLRWFIITHSLGVLDADEATTGLVARHFLHNGEHPVFYWSSNYGGTIEAATTALAFIPFGASVAVLKWASVA